MKKHEQFQIVCPLCRTAHNVSIHNQAERDALKQLALGKTSGFCFACRKDFKSPAITLLAPFKERI